MLLFGHTESLQRRWWPTHHAPLKALISAALHSRRRRSAISTIWSAGQLGFVSWAQSDEWIISSHLSLSKHTVSKGWIVEDIKYRQGGENIVMNIWKPSSGRNMLRERKMYLCWMSSKIFFLGIDASLQALFQENWQFHFVTPSPIWLSICVCVSLPVAQFT